MLLTGATVTLGGASDSETGLADWSVEDIKRAVITGERPDGRIHAGMPRPSDAALTPEDATALASSIKSRPPIRHAATPKTGASERAPGPVLTVR